MSTPVLMPQMGESIAEGTIVRWMKKVGDQVDRDEPLFEISTDKVDAEIPSPAAGVLAEIRSRKARRSRSTASSRRSATRCAAASSPADRRNASSSDAVLPHVVRRARRARREDPWKWRRGARSRRRATRPLVPVGSPHRQGAQRRHFRAPRIWRGGRVTKHDILDYLDQRPAGGRGQRRRRHTPASSPESASSSCRWA